MSGGPSCPATPVPMLHRRQLLAGLPGAALLPAFPRLGPRTSSELAELRTLPGSPEALAGDEAFWGVVQRAFAVDRSMVNLNSGGVASSSRVVQEALSRHMATANEAPAYKMWRLQEPQKETVRAGLARLFGVDAEEVAITRNASESLETVLFGHDLEPGDEVLTTTQDYPRMLACLRQRSRREGIVLRQVKIPVPLDDPAELVRRFAAEVTDRTRLILCCQVINLTGQVLPVAELCALGRELGVPVMVDGAHGFAMDPARREDLGCDFYATSLHKWLHAPLGTGMLYVKRDRIAKVWPLMAADEVLDNDIRKYEQVGTYPLPVPLAIAEAIALHDDIGPERKAARMVWLRDRWARRLATNDRVHFNTNLSPGSSYGIANVRLDGIDTGALRAHLWRKHRIYTISIQQEEVDGLRVSPAIYTTPAEIDRFTEAVEEVLEKGLPG